MSAVVSHTVRRSIALRLCEPFQSAQRRAQHRLALAMPKRKRTFGRFTPYGRGIAYGMSLMGASLEHIAKTVEKSDGAHPCQQSIAECIQLCKDNGGVSWDGDAAALGGAGRPRG